MKKTLLSLSILMMAIAVMAQPTRMTKQQAATIAQEKVVLTGNETVQDSPISSPLLRNTSKQFIGTTYYDLQTNGSVPSKIIAHNDGTISAAWTTCGPSATTRGTGYNYFSGNEWANSSTSLDRIETARAGWGVIATLGENATGEIIVSHDGSTGLLINTRNEKGVGDWNQTTLLGPEASNGSAVSTCLLWPAIATVGNTIHLVACTESDAGFLYQGIATCLVYYRGTYNPTTNSITWDANSPQVVGGLTSANVARFEGDGYCIAAKDNNIAILVAGSFTDVILCKSTDGGTTWTNTTIFDSPIEPTTTSVIDTPYVADASSAIAISDNGVVHVAFGLSRVLKEDMTASTYSYFPGVDGLLYWNSTMNPIPTNTAEPRNTMEPEALIAAGYKVFQRPDLDGDDTAWFMNSGNFPGYGVGISSFPQLVTNGNNVYLIFTSLLDYPFIDFNSSSYYRGVFGCKSTDNGANWETGMSWLSYNDDCYYIDWASYPGVESADLVPDCILMDGENVFPAVAKDVVNGNINMLWQNSYIAGSEIKDNSVAVATNESRIYWLQLPAEEIGTWRSTSTVYTGSWNVDGIVDNSLSAMKVYPNPASEVVNVVVSSKENTNANIVITNIMGQVVYNQQQALSNGANHFVVNVNNLANGIYMLSIKTNTGISTQKLMVR